MSIQIIRRAATLAIAVAVLAGGAAHAREDGSADMPIGAVTTAPAGFIELCERAPAECLATVRPSDQMLADVRAWAGRARWAAVFHDAGLATAPAAVPARPAIRTMRTAKPASPEAIRTLKDQRRKHPRPRALKIPPTQIAPGAAPAAAPAVRPVAIVSTDALETLTRRINRSVRRSSDADAYGREDVWALPQGRRPTGDCEDYVLAKRRALIEEGVDPAALSIAIVRTRRGEIHAVLLVATADGEKVLDNLTPWVLPWREAPYDWLERQAPGQPLVWARAAA